MKMKLLSAALLTCLSLSSTFAAAAQVILQTESVGHQPGAKPIGVRLYSDGKAVAYNDKKESPLAIIDAAIVAKANARIESIVAGELTKVDPKQNYNPGGFVRKYDLVKANGDAFVFFQNVSGVDFGLKNNQGAQEKQLLDAIQTLSYVAQ